MHIDKWYWVPWAIAILGGGAMGAVINALVTHHRNKIQKIGYTENTIHIFRKGQHFPRLGKLTVIGHPLGVGEEEPVENLAVTQISVTNTGNQNIENFKFGVTMEGEYKVVDVLMKQPDRHHTMSVGLSEKSAVTNPDFYLEPFNRTDTYAVDIYFTYKNEPGPVQLTTAHPVRFTRLGINKKELLMFAGALMMEMIPGIGFIVRDREKQSS